MKNMATSTSNSDEAEPRGEVRSDEVKTKLCDSEAKSKSIYQEAIHSRQLDGLILVNFFMFFVVSFLAGLLFLYSSLSLWSFQVCEDGDLYQPIQFAPHMPSNLISIITYNASAPLSLTT